MSSNVGLSTPRGSGTSGYVQRNLSHLKPRDNGPRPDNDLLPQHTQRQPDAAILDHDRRRAVEVQVFTLRDSLEEQGVDEEEIDTRCEALRRKLNAGGGDAAGGDGRGRGGVGGKEDVRRLKSHQVHEIAAAKIREDERLRRALGIRGDYEEGAHWRRQEERKRDEGKGRLVEEVRAEKRVDVRRKDVERSAARDRSRSPRRSRSGSRSISPRRERRSLRSRSRSYSKSSRSESDSD